MTSTNDHNKGFSQTPWSYAYNPYTMSKVAQAASKSNDTEIPAFEICDAHGNKIFDTNEDSPEALQEANACLATAAPELLLSLIECADILADHDETEGPEGQAYRSAIAIIDKVTASNRPSSQDIMRQQVEVTMTLTFWLDAEMDADEIATYVRGTSLLAFGEALTHMLNPVDILMIREEAEIYGNV